MAFRHLCAFKLGAAPCWRRGWGWAMARDLVPIAAACDADRWGRCFNGGADLNRYSARKLVTCQRGSQFKGVHHINFSTSSIRSSRFNGIYLDFV